MWYKNIKKELANLPGEAAHLEMIPFRLPSSDYHGDYNNAKLSAVQSVAQLRIARIQIEQGELELALASADKVTDEAFKGQSQEIKGDVYQAQQLFDKARAAYSSALETNARDQVLKMKLDNLALAANS